MTLLAAGHFPGVVIQPIVGFDLRGVGQLVTNKCHVAGGAGDDLPAITIDQRTPLQRSAERAFAHPRPFTASRTREAAALHCNFHTRDSTTGREALRGMMEEAVACRPRPAGCIANFTLIRFPGRTYG